MTQAVNLAAAETFIWLNARLIDRHRYTHLFKGGDAGRWLPRGAFTIHALTTPRAYGRMAA